MDVMYELRKRGSDRKALAADEYRDLMWASEGTADIAKLERLMVDMGLSDTDVEQDLAAVERWRMNDTSSEDEREAAEAELALDVVRRKLEEFAAGWAEKIKAAKELSIETRTAYLRDRTNPHRATAARVCAAAGKADEQLNALLDQFDSLRKGIDREEAGALQRVQFARRSSNERTATRIEIRRRFPRLFDHKGLPPVSERATPATRATRRFSFDAKQADADRKLRNRRTATVDRSNAVKMKYSIAAPTAGAPNVGE